MDGKTAVAESGGTASSQREALAERERVGDKRQRKADERERLADERERRADDREHVADDREHLADDRERLADEREVVADERERLADEREREMDEREHALGSVIETLEERTLDNIERSRALLALSGQRLNRGEAAVKRAQARRRRQQAQIGRASAETDRTLLVGLPDPGRPIERAEALRKHSCAAIEAFAATEDEIARIHEELAASRPDRRDEYRQIAEQARKTARKARQMLRAFSD